MDSALIPGFLNGVKSTPYFDPTHLGEVRLYHMQTQAADHRSDQDRLHHLFLPTSPFLSSI